MEGSQRAKFSCCQDLKRYTRTNRLDHNRNYVRSQLQSVGVLSYFVVNTKSNESIKVQNPQRQCILHIPAHALVSTAIPIIMHAPSKPKISKLAFFPHVLCRNS